ncbi:MAG: EAL domain-containing protein [Eubacteriales bacterium]
MEETKISRPSSSHGLRSIEQLYQPVFDTHLNMAIDFETTMRINDRKLGVLMPHSFIPIAEKSNQICELGKWALEEGCDCILRCEKRDVDINGLILLTSVRHLAKKNFVQQMTKIVEAKGVNPDKFCFNINESILQAEKAQVLANISALRKYGFLVSIDDFGVEYTSLSHLGQYEVDYIGINESMLDGIQSDERAQNMLQGIIDFAKKLVTQTRINGVDTQEKADFLKIMGVDQMKGKLYGDAMQEKKIS